MNYVELVVPYFILALAHSARPHFWLLTFGSLWLLDAADDLPRSFVLLSFL